MKRFLALALALIMVFSVMAGTVQVALAAAGDPSIEGTVTDDALHFIIRHWHNDDTADTNFQGDKLTGTGDRYFVVVEGYIVPSGGTHRFYFVHQDTGALEEVRPGDPLLATSAYIKSLDAGSGTVVLKASPIGTVERFSAFSISAGHAAARYTSTSDTVEITYRPDVHLVKGHAFYIRNSRIVLGEDFFKNDEIDTRIDENQVKEYNTAAGLHTDKTASLYTGTAAGGQAAADPLNDGRTFNLDLEAWYSEGRGSQVGMVLDASGSMAFTSDPLEPINVYKVLGIQEDGGVAAQAEDALSSLLSKVGASGRLHYVYPQWDRLTGYYPFNRQNKGTPEDDHRDWLVNAASGADALGVAPMAAGGTPSFVGTEVADWSNGYKMSDSNGFALKASQNGIMLGTVPSGRSFTVSFRINKEKSDGSSDQGYAEILYIGSADGNEDYIRVVRDGRGSGSLTGTNAQNRLKVLQGSDNTRTPLLSINNVFSSTGAKTITLTLVCTEENGSVGLDIYVDGEQIIDSSAKYHADGVALSASGIRIVFNGIADNYGEYGGESELYVDDVYFYDTALSAEDVKTLHGFAVNKTDVNTAEAIRWDEDVFLTEEELALVLNTRNTDNSLLGNSGYSYFVYNPRDAVTEFAPLGYWDGYGVEPVKADDGTTVYVAKTKDPVTGDEKGLGAFATNIERQYEGMAGWYYVNPTEKWNSHYNNVAVQTAKTLNGIIGGNALPFEDIVTIPNALVGYYSQYPHVVATGEGGNGNTTSVYTANDYTPTRFYIDQYGYLRCFFATGTRGETIADRLWGTSYVFLLEDIDYIKAESLQRAVGAFVTALEESSPTSQVSAVRFSTKDVQGDDLERLVLLKWTDDASVSANILSLMNGDGTQGNGNDEYNYGLTGNTTTSRGLEAFREHLHDSESTMDKYLIIFTDGRDTEITYDAEGNPDFENHEAVKIATELKEKDGYTIFTIMLAGGPVTLNSADYNTAREFLLRLSTDEDHFMFAEDVDELTDAFLDKILPDITHDLLDYNVEDYIDPRFDLVDAKGIVWHLNAGGEIVRGSETIRVNDTNGVEITLSEAKDVDPTAYVAQLYYSAKNDMYFLRWTKQTIPAGALGGKEPLVWRARVTVRAKDDFIGGNAVLSNGNDKEMNWVYHPDDGDRSSGTDDMMKSYDSNDKVTDPYPSKGFPRTVVNVTPIKEDLVRSQLIYMGETLTPGDVAQRLVMAAWQEAEASELARYYWEYLLRYSNKTGESLESLSAKIIGSADGLRIPYYYLPDADKSNQTGTPKHRDDVIGYLIYKTEEAKPEDYPAYLTADDVRSYPADGVTKDTDSRVTKLTVTFDPLLLGADDAATRNKENKALVVDSAYAWTPSYKPANVGELLEEKVVIIKGVYVTRIVAGEIVLQLVIPKDVIKALQDGGLAGEMITYAAKLQRSYGSANDAVGTFTLTYKVPSAAPSADALVSVNLSDIAFESAYAYAGDYGLPIGDYTVVKDTAGTSTSSAYRFGDIIAVPELTTVQHAAYFSLYPQKVGKTLTSAEMSLSDFLATYRAGTTVPLLGTDSANGLVYTNERYALMQVRVELGAATGNLAVSKVVSGDDGDQQQAFSFMIMLSDTGVNGVYGDMKFANGVASFTLKHGETKTATGLPAGIRYSVSESGAEEDGYAVTSNGASGQISADETVKAVFVNARDKIPDVPQTGDNSQLELWLALLLVSAIGAGVSVLTIRRRTQR